MPLCGHWYVDGGGIVMDLASRPPFPARVAKLSRANTIEQLLWTLIAEELEDARPVGEMKTVRETASPIAKERDGTQAAAQRLRADNGMVGGGGIGGSHPEAAVS